MSFRRFVHLVADDVNLRRRTYSLRSIDMSPLFHRCRPPEPTGVSPPPPEMEPCALPAPAMSFHPPRWRIHHLDGVMEFMLLGGRHNKVIAADQTGRAVLYDPDRHAVETLPAFAGRKNAPVAFTVRGGDRLYVLDANPGPGHEDTCLECFEQDPGGEDDWRPRVLPPPPLPYPCDEDPYAAPSVVSYAAAGDGSRIWISDEHAGTYAFDAAAEAWSRAGDWTLPFHGLAEHVPEHGLWFGLGDNDDRCELCAVDLATASARRAPAVRGRWEDLAPPPEWETPPTSRLVHLGSSRFCIARFFADTSGYPVTRAVFTAVEVERCAGAEGGIRMVKHGSKLYTLLHYMTYWVL